MNRILMNLKYKARVQWIMSAWYLAIYPIAMIIISYALIKTSVISETNGSLIYRLWGAVIFLFAISIKFREDFDFLLTLSNTRKEIYYSLIVVAIGFGAFFSGLIVLEKVLVDYLNHMFGYYHIVDPFHFVAPYATNNLLLQFIFFLMLCTCCSIFGLLIGSLFYRFGKKFMVVFWILFSAIPVVFFPIFLWILHQHDQLSKSAKLMGEFFLHFDLLDVSGVLLSLIIIFSVAGWLNIRRLPQK